MTGDIVKAVVPAGKHKGTWTGRVLCRRSGFFDIKTKKARIQGISYRFCHLIQNNDGYQYFNESKNPLSCRTAHYNRSKRRINFQPKAKKIQATADYLRANSTFISLPSSTNVACTRHVLRQFTEAGLPLNTVN